MQKLLLAGMILFLLGLINGVLIPYFEIPRMGMSAHLAAMSSAVALMMFGFVYEKLNLSPNALRLFSFLSIGSMYVIWFFILIGALWNTGQSVQLGEAVSIASDSQEMIVSVGFMLGSAALVLATILGIIGLYKKE